VKVASKSLKAMPLQLQGFQKLKMRSRRLDPQDAQLAAQQDAQLAAQHAAQ